MFETKIFMECLVSKGYLYLELNITDQNKLLILFRVLRNIEFEDWWTLGSGTD